MTHVLLIMNQTLDSVDDASDRAIIHEFLYNILPENIFELCQQLCRNVKMVGRNCCFLMFELFHHLINGGFRLR